MRNFDERKAEIFRRSEQRIKERKQNRRRILTVCVPLCLALTVGSAAILPEMLPVGPDNASGENALMPEYSGAATVSKVQIDVIDPDASKDELTDESYILFEGTGQMYYSMESAFEKGRGEENDKPGDSQLDISTEELILGGKHLPGYRITFVFWDGSEEVYTLEGYTLTNNTSAKSITLTETQRNEILEKLGLEEAK